MKVSQAIAEDFRAKIARGDLKVGDPLPVELALVQELGASKPVVREALRILETEGLIEIRRGIGGGARVRHPSISQTAKTMGVYLQIGDVLVADVWTARDRIIAAAVERLATDPPTDLEPLELAVKELATRVGVIDDYYLLLIEVGETAVRLAGNATETALVAALRHIIAAELEAATNAVVDVDVAVAAEMLVASAWRDALKHIKGGRPRAARLAFERQALQVQEGVSKTSRLEGMTVVDVVSTHS